MKRVIAISLLLGAGCVAVTAEPALEPQYSAGQLAYVRDSIVVSHCSAANALCIAGQSGAFWEATLTAAGWSCSGLNFDAQAGSSFAGVLYRRYCSDIR